MLSTSEQVIESTSVIGSTTIVGANLLTVNDYDEVEGTVSVDYALPITSTNTSSTNLQQIKVKLDTTTKAQLTPKFIKSNSTSAWSKLIQEMDKYYLINTDSSHVYSEEVINYVKTIGDLFCEGFKTDLEAMANGLKVSDCGLFAPRIRSTYNRIDRPVRLVYYIVEKIFV